MGEAALCFKLKLWQMPSGASILEFHVISHVNDAIDAPQNNLKGADCSTCEVTEEDYSKGGVWFLFFKVKILLELMF